MRSSGLVGVSTQSSFVSGRIAASTAARSVKSTKSTCETGRALAHPLEQPERAAIDVVGGDDMGAAVEQLEARWRSPPGPRRRRSRPRRFPGRRRRARRRSASGSGCAHIRSPCARPGSAGRRSRWRRSAPSPRRSSGRGSGRHGWCASRRPGGFCGGVCRSSCAPQMVDQVDAGDQADELVAVEDDGDLVAVEHRQQRVERLAGLQRVQLRRSWRCAPAR